MRFELAPNARNPEITSPAVSYEGYRFRITCVIAGKQYGQPFGLDVVYGDPVIRQPGMFTAADRLGFLGITPPTFKIYPVESHIAEKLHAFTMPRGRPNSRVRDLPDIALLATITSISSTDLRTALEQTFSFRSTHGIPRFLPSAPDAWRKPFESMALEYKLEWTTLAALETAVQEFLKPILECQSGLTWQPEQWAWV